MHCHIRIGEIDQRQRAFVCCCTIYLWIHLTSWLLFPAANCFRYNCVRFCPIKDIPYNNLMCNKLIRFQALLRPFQQFHFEIPVRNAITAPKITQTNSIEKYRIDLNKFQSQHFRLSFLLEHEKSCENWYFLENDLVPNKHLDAWIRHSHTKIRSIIPWKNDPLN